MTHKRIEVCDNMDEKTSKHCLTTQEREKILQRIHSLLFWVGEFVPDTYELDGKQIMLRDTIFNFIAKPDPSEEEIEAALSLAERLQQDVKDREADLRSRNISVEDAKELMAEVAGLMRAVDELRNMNNEQADYSKQLLLDKVNDERRWLKFVKEVK
jgi:hypothetical protein